MSKLIKLTCLAMLSQLTFPAHAIQVSTTELFVGCDAPNAHTKMLNETNERVFINVESGEYTYNEDGKLTGSKSNYKDGEIKDVGIVVRPSKAILGPKEERRVNFNLFDNSCSSKTDKLYSVVYVPSAVPGEANTMKLMIGLGGIVTVMPKNPKLSYEFKSSKDNLEIKNNGESVIKGKIVSCKEKSKKCVSTFRVHHTRTFGIPKNILSEAEELILTAPSNPEWKVEMSHDEIKKLI